MKDTPKNLLSYDSYFEKRYEITKEVLVALVGTMELDIIKAKKQREAMVFYSLQLADDLMNGLNYGLSQSGDSNNSQTITSIADLMKAASEDDGDDSEE